MQAQRNKRMRLIGYTRVSRVGGREGESFITLAVQRETIEAYAKANGHKVVEWIEDTDESGGSLNRPASNKRSN